MLREPQERRSRSEEPWGEHRPGWWTTGGAFWGSGFVLSLKEMSDGSWAERLQQRYALAAKRRVQAEQIGADGENNLGNNVESF